MQLARLIINSNSGSFESNVLRNRKDHSVQPKTVSKTVRKD